MDQFKQLYQIIYDDIKDADMIIHYAYHLKEEQPEKKNLADTMAKNAKARLDHAIEMHKIFVAEAQSMSAQSNQSCVESCLWKETHMHYKEWYDKILDCITKY